MGGRAALLVVLLLVATCAWASPINRDSLEVTSKAPQGPTEPVSTPVQPAAKNETSSKDAPTPAQSSGIAAEKEGAESPVTEVAPEEAAEKVAAAAEIEESKEKPPVTEKVEVEEVAVPAKVEKTREESSVSKIGEADEVVIPEKVEQTNEVSPVTEKAEAEKVEDADEKESTIVEKADVIKQSETILSEEEVTTSAPIEESKAVEKASPSSPEESEIAEDVTTVSPAADEEIIEERFRSAQVESDTPETTEKSELEVDSSKQKEKDNKPIQDAVPVVEKSLDGAVPQEDEDQSSATESISAAATDKIKVERIQDDDVAVPFEEEIVVTEAAIEATTVTEEEDQEAAEATTPFDDSSDREDTTDEPSDRIAAESSDVEIVTAIFVESKDGSFRQGDIEITEAPEEDDISSTTANPQSEQDINAEIRGEDETTTEHSTETPVDRVDSETDIIYVDVTTEQPEETTEELIQAESLLRKLEVEEDAATEAPEVEKEKSGSIDMQDEGAQAITTEATFEEITEISSSQTFDDAAPIKVVEIVGSIKSVESIVPADSAPIEIVEITEKSQLLAKDKAEVKVQAVNEKESTASEPEIVQTTEIIPDEKEEATTISSESSAIRDEQEVPSSSGSDQDQEPEEGEEKPNSSKIQPAPAADYWLSMQAEGNESAQAPAKPAKPSETAEKVPAEAVEEAEDVEINIRGGESSNSTDVATTAAVAVSPDVSGPAAAVSQETSIDDEIAKVAQKYGLQSVGKVSSDVKPVQEEAADAQVVSDADVPKEDSIYLGNESKKTDFQESNDLQRRHSFGDKVVRFVRSFL